jgi:hypothetical protein
VSPPGHAGTLSKREINLWRFDSVVFVAAYGTTLYSEAGYKLVVIIISWMIGDRRADCLPPDHKLRCSLTAEGCPALSADAGVAVAWLSGRPWSTLVSAWLRQPWGNSLVWFMTVAKLPGEPTHHVLLPVLVALKEGAGYTCPSGMGTAPFPAASAVLPGPFSSTAAPPFARKLQRPLLRARSAGRWHRLRWSPQRLCGLSPIDLQPTGQNADPNQAA